jgi:hypothetical protein
MHQSPFVDIDSSWTQMDPDQRVAINLSASGNDRIHSLGSQRPYSTPRASELATSLPTETLVAAQKLDADFVATLHNGWCPVDSIRILPLSTAPGQYTVLAADVNNQAIPTFLETANCRVAREKVEDPSTLPRLQSLQNKLIAFTANMTPAGHDHLEFTECGVPGADLSHGRP